MNVHLVTSSLFPFLKTGTTLAHFSPPRDATEVEGEIVKREVKCVSEGAISFEHFPGI